MERDGDKMERDPNRKYPSNENSYHLTSDVKHEINFISILCQMIVFSPAGIYGYHPELVPEDLIIPNAIAFSLNWI